MHMNSSPTIQGEQLLQNQNGFAPVAVLEEEYISFSISNSSDDDELKSQTSNTGAMVNGKMEENESFHTPANRRRRNSKVSFTIGDSSDCESFSTTSSMAGARNSIDRGNRELGDDDENDEIHWHKYHFHYVDDNGTVDGDVKVPVVKQEASKSGSKDKLNQTSPSNDLELKTSLDVESTRVVVPNSDISLGRLADVSEEEGDSQISWFKKFGKWRILIVCAIVQLFSALTVSLQAPFYPAEAEKKGMSATAYGFVFGVFELTVFFAAPLYGSKMHNWNSKLIFNAGIFTAAISSIVFGVLDKIDDGRYFIGACVLVRAIEALGEAAVVMASFIIVASAFPDSVASTFAILEAFYSIGLISGPIVGSILYELGGFSLPFWTVGGSLLASALLSFLILPSSDEISALYQGNERIVISSYKSFALLKSAKVAVSAMCIVTAAMSIAYLQATLEPHLRNFQISQLTTGAILVINGGIYTITAPFWGLLCDKILQLKLVTFFGSAVLLCGFSVIGPLPILPFTPALWIVAVGLAVQGFGLGAMLVSSFMSIVRNVINSGFPDSPSTYGLVSSLWTSMFSLGSFIGPSLSGVLFDAVGFSWGTLSVISALLIMMCILLLFICTSTSELESFVGSEESPLLNATTLSASVYSGDPQPSTSKAAKYRISNRRNSYGSI